MKGQELIINFEDDKAYLSREKIFTLRELDFPAIAQRFKSPAVWTIKVLGYNRAEGKIFVEILSYKVGKLPFPKNQLLLQDDLKNVHKLTFKSIDTFALLHTLSGVTKPRTIAPSFGKFPEREEGTELNYNHRIKRESQIQNIKETFFIPLKNIRFKFGCIAFDKRVSKLNRLIEFEVHNDDIREEFDAIKNYFGNVLQVKKFQFDITIQLKDGEIISIETKSPEVSKINQKLIESVKFEFVKSFTRKKIEIEIDKSLFTMDEFFDFLTEEKVKANVFYNNENDLFEDLLQITDTKHYKHLRFLSSKHAHSIMKLRFVIRPFSFIFLIEGEKNYHIIWETLDTEEATYIWHEDKNLNKLKLTLEKIDNILNVIKVQGKTAYLNSSEDQLRRIYHDYSELVDGFVKWKSEIESVLT